MSDTSECTYLFRYFTSPQFEIDETLLLWNKVYATISKRKKESIARVDEWVGSSQILEYFKY